ncbi:MAG: NUDIX hydrolase [Armatimonadetes bacterium]|nr:NUDIX hydrolase [Armatimonadota bacterium]MDW8029291.1 NUDIX hydrolase [Armatimonadota bacterium]
MPSDISRSVLRAVERRYGKPKVVRLRWRINDDDLAMIKASQKDGRAHDVTLFIFRKDKLAVIRKHNHPKGVYRAPSGAVKRGEEFEAGAMREAYEETGLTIQLQRYLLRVRVKFVAPSGSVDWTTHIFTAKAVKGRLKPVDTREIESAKWATLSEIQGKIRDAMLSSGRSLLRYRVWLTDKVVSMLIANQGNGFAL